MIRRKIPPAMPPTIGPSFSAVDLVSVSESERSEVSDGSALFVEEEGMELVREAAVDDGDPELVELPEAVAVA